MNGSIFLQSFAGIQTLGSKSRTSPAIRVANAEASKLVIGPMPERPLTMLSQAEARSLPTGDTMPMPVITTRRFAMHKPSAIDIHQHPRDEMEEHTSELQSLMRISYAVFCLKKKTIQTL